MSSARSKIISSAATVAILALAITSNSGALASCTDALSKLLGSATPDFARCPCVTDRSGPPAKRPMSLEQLKKREAAAAEAVAQRSKDTAGSIKPDTHFDYVIAGGGPAAVTLAADLRAKGKTVLVIGGAFWDQAASARYGRITQPVAEVAPSLWSAGLGNAYDFAPASERLPTSGLVVLLNEARAKGPYLQGSVDGVTGADGKLTITIKVPDGKIQVQGSAFIDSTGLGPASSTVSPEVKRALGNRYTTGTEFILAKDYALPSDTKSVLILGIGGITTEVYSAENGLPNSGLKITLIQSSKVWGPLADDPRTRNPVSPGQNSIGLVTDNTRGKISERDGRPVYTTPEGKVYEADVIIQCAGQQSKKFPDKTTVLDTYDKSGNFLYSTVTPPNAPPTVFFGASAWKLPRTGAQAEKFENSINKTLKYINNCNRGRNDRSNGNPPFGLMFLLRDGFSRDTANSLGGTSAK